MFLDLILTKRVWYGILGMLWLAMNRKDTPVRAKMNPSSRRRWGLFRLIANVDIGSEPINV